MLRMINDILNATNDISRLRLQTSAASRTIERGRPPHATSTGSAAILRLIQFHQQMIANGLLNLSNSLVAKSKDVEGAFVLPL